MVPPIFPRRWPLVRRHPFLGQLGDGIRRLLDSPESHAVEHVGRLGELDVAVGHYLDAVAPGVAEIEALVQGLDAQPLQGGPHRRPVVDHEAEMALAVGILGLAEAQLDELVAKVDEGIVVAAAAQGEVEDGAVELQRLIQVAPPPAPRD